MHKSNKHEYKDCEKNDANAVLSDTKEHVILSLFPMMRDFY